MVAVVTGFPARSRRRPHGGPTPSRRYERRRPEKTPLHKVVSENLESWLQSRDRAERPVLIDRDVPSYFRSLEHLLRYCARPPFALERLSVIRSPDRCITRVRYVLPRHKAATGGHAVGGHATGGCCDTHAKPRSHDTSRIAWAKLMARAGEEFPLACPTCGGDIRLIAFRLLSECETIPGLRTLGNPRLLRTSCPRTGADPEDSDTPRLGETPRPR